MPSTVELTFSRGGCTLFIVMTPTRIKRLEYRNHPGYNTRALGAAYALTRNTPGAFICTCMDMADSLVRAFPAHFAAPLYAAIRHNDFDARKLLGDWVINNDIKCRARATKRGWIE